MTNEVAHTLRVAKALIDTPEKWTKKHGARDAGGNVVSFSSKSAVCFCAYSALNLVALKNKTRNVTYASASRALTKESQRLTGKNYIALNDNPDTTHTDIITLFDDAIAMAESEEE